MALTSGTKLGSYEVVALIGAGGMGEVYQAHDTKLGRDVAIKVLPEAFAHDAERLSRFQREAKMLAALNHANIATIYGLEQSGGTSYLVMELVSGETLAERVNAGPLSIEEALKIAVQIVEALEAAHEKNIIHRDLKPANVKVTPEGKVKVLDFGLAKAFEGDNATEEMSNSPTLSPAATMQGVILGTAAYMSPEQAKGKQVDKRTDIWSFGAVLYELLTGMQAFHGETTTEILAAVLREEPDWQALPASIPVKIRELLRRCLQKDLRRRMRDAADARIEIEEALAAPATPRPAGAANGVRSLGQRVLIFSLGSLLLGAAIAGLAVWSLKLSPTQPVTRTVINLPPGQQLAIQNYYNPVLALSHDGSHLAYIAIRDGTQQLYLRPMDSTEAKPLPDTEGAINPFFSPDGKWLGFFAAGKLKKVSVNGGAAVPLADAALPRGASWSSEGKIAFTPNVTGAIEQVSDSGGITQPLVQFKKGEFSQRWPEFLPDGKGILVGTGGGAGLNWEVGVQSPSGGRQKLVGGGIYPRYAISGHLLYVQGGTLMAVPFDARRLTITGTATPVVENILGSALTGASQYDISETGTLAYLSGGVQFLQQEIVWVTRSGAEQPLPATLHAYQTPRISHDGRRVAVQILEQNTDVWLYDLARGTLTRLTVGGNANEWPVWTPDDKRVAFWSNRDGGFNLYWQLADGSAPMERLTGSDYLQIPDSFSPDGQLLAFTQQSPTGGYEVWVLRLSDRKVEPFLPSPFDVKMPRFSPDGRWLAYSSDESGRLDVYVQPYPGPGGKVQISTDGGTEPVWNRNGRELFFRSGNKMMAVDVATQPA